MARKTHFATTTTSIVDSYTNPDQQEPTSGVQENSLKNLTGRKKGKTPKNYIQLDIYGFEKYIDCMIAAKPYDGKKKVTRTGYIRNLIRKDMEANQELYEFILSSKNKVIELPKKYQQ